MSEVNYEILETEHGLDTKLIIIHIDNSKQIEKYCVSLSDPTVIKSTKTRQKKGLIELLRNIKGWNCEICDKQFYNSTSNIKHMSSKAHKAKSLGTELIDCSNKGCRKKFATKDEFEEHIQYSQKCRKSPKNNDKVYMIEAKQIKRLLMKGWGGANWTATEIQFYNTHLKKNFTKEDAEDFNIIKNEYGVFYSESKHKSEVGDVGDVVAVSPKKLSREELEAKWDREEAEIERQQDEWDQRDFDEKERMYEMGARFRNHIPCSLLASSCSEGEEEESDEIAEPKIIIKKKKKLKIKTI